jgi:hypothetical protein
MEEERNANVPGTTSDGRAGLLSLPPEVHHLIVSYLPYPDLLSIKLSHPYFQALLDSQPTVHQRIAWVLSRGRIHLPIPHDSKTNFRTDVLFLRNPEVTKIIRRRRQHLECVNCILARRIAWLQYTGTSDERRRRLCFVNEGYECPRLRELDEKKAMDEKRLRHKLLRLVGWPNGYWESGSVYWERRGPYPPGWFISLTSWFGPSPPRVGLHVPTLILDFVLLTLLVAGIITMQVCGFTFGGIWKSISRSLWQWFEAMWMDWAHDLQLPP